MDEDQFWLLVEDAAEAGGDDPERRYESLSAALRPLEPNALQAFDVQMTKQLARGFSWELWGAAALLNGGCGDDTFVDFRSTLISLGRETYEMAIDDPDGLADIEVDEPEDLFFEGFDGVAAEVAEDLHGTFTAAAVDVPEEPKGEQFDFEDEEEMARRFPRLWEKGQDDREEDEDEDEDGDDEE